MSYNPFSLSGKTILVTGASSGIGQATAIECSKLGAKLVITGRNAERLQETMNKLEGEGHCQILAELTDVADVQRLVSGAQNLDGVVLCAGKAKTLPFAFSTRENFDDIMAVNYFAPVELLRLLVKGKKLNKQSSVVFVSSVGGVFLFGGANTIYGASKAAINSTMRYCASELAAKKIRVNSVNPGMVETGLIHRGTISDEQLQEDVKRYPLKRYGEPIDIAHGIIYLLSDASSWVTGHSLVIDGGVTI